MDDKYRIDSTKIHFHPRRVAQWLEGKDQWETAKSIYPIYWEITTAAACPHRCIFCSTDALEYLPNLVDADILIERMEEAAKLGVKSVMFAGSGEPLLHKRINDIVLAAHSFGLKSAFTTNGVLLDKLAAPNLCEWIKVSLNAGSRDNYAAIHQTKPKDWDKVWENIRDMVKRKGQCAIGVQCVVLPENYHEMLDLAVEAKDAGADYLVLKPYSQATFSIVQRSDIHYQEFDDALQQIEKAFNGFVIYKSKAFARESAAEAHGYNRCSATPYFWMYTRAEGDVSICSAHLLDERFYVGNINKQSLKEIWEGERRHKAWELMREFDTSACRKNCRMQATNEYLHELASEPLHAAFI